MGLFHVSDSRPPKRDKQLLIRLTADEKALLEKEASRRDMTVADLVRNAVNAYVSTGSKKQSKRP